MQRPSVAAENRGAALPSCSWRCWVSVRSRSPRPEHQEVSTSTGHGKRICHFGVHFSMLICCRTPRSLPPTPTTHLRHVYSLFHHVTSTPAGHDAVAKCCVFSTTNARSNGEFSVPHSSTGNTSRVQASSTQRKCPRFKRLNWRKRPKQPKQPMRSSANSPAPPRRLAA